MQLFWCCWHACSTSSFPFVSCNGAKTYPLGGDKLFCYVWSWKCSIVNIFLVQQLNGSMQPQLWAEGQCPPHWERLLFFVPAWGNCVPVFDINQQWRCARAACLGAPCICHSPAFACVCVKIDFSNPAWNECGTTRHTDKFVRGRHCDVSDSCLCVQMPFHMHALFWHCVRPRLHLLVSWVFSRQRAAEQRRASAPSFHLKNFQERAAAAAQWKPQCSVTSRAGL